MTHAFTTRLDRTKRSFLALGVVTAWLLGATAAVAADSVPPVGTTWTPCANEGSVCSFSGTRFVRYGANTTWTVRELAAQNGGVSCNNTVFGDPLFGTRKRCDIGTVPASSTPPPSTTTTWTKIADEWTSFTLTGTQLVRYGSGATWIEKTVTGTGQCTNTFFGRDPLPNVVKQCQVAGGTTTPPPPATAPVTLRWAQPTANSTVRDTVQLQLTGQAFQNVEIFRNGQMLVRATVSADRMSATASLDTKQFANGPVTVTAHAWNSPPGTAFTSDADAGSLTFTVSNTVTPPPPTGEHELLGVYVGNDPNEVLKFENWLGRRVDGFLGYTGHASWADYDGSVRWAARELWPQIDRRVFWSVPLIPTGASLSEAARGDYNAHYRNAAEILVGFRPQEPQLHIRTGWEFNGDWFPWAAKGKEADFVGAFRQFVTVFRQVAVERGVPNRFVFEWNVNIGNVGMDPATAYPGDDYVDIIGMDFYWNTQWGDSTDPMVAWNSMLDRPWGLRWHQDFARARGKRTSYSEWGVQGNNATPYIQQAKAWFQAHDVVFHTYWDSNASYPGKLSNGQYPNSGAGYRAAFSAP